MGDKVKKVGIAIIVAIIIYCIGWLLVTLGNWMYKEFTTEYTYKERTVKGTITRMSYEEGEWEKKPKTKETKKSDGTVVKETIYVDEYDEPEYEINFECPDKDGNMINYFYEEETSELYDYLKDAKLKRGDTVDLKVKDTYGNGEYRYSAIIDVKTPHDDKYRKMLD